MPLPLILVSVVKAQIEEKINSVGSFYVMGHFCFYLLNYFFLRIKLLSLNTVYPETCSWKWLQLFNYLRQ